MRRMTYHYKRLRVLSLYISLHEAQSSSLLMGKMKCIRVIIEGITSYAIQGINLREKIEKYVRTHLNTDRIKARGKISNLKNGQVEIIFCGEKSDLDNLLRYLPNTIMDKENRKEVKVIKRIERYQIEIESDTFSDFTVERSDDLS